MYNRVQEEETNIVDQAVESTDEPTPDTEHQETAGSEDKPTRTLKLNRSAASTTEESTSADGEEPTAAADSDTAQSNEEGEQQGGGRNRRNRNRRNRREPHVPSENPMSLTELKTKSTQELIDMAAEMGIENMARSRKQDIIFRYSRNTQKAERTFLATVCLRSFPMVLVSCDQRIARFWQAPTISTSVRAKSDDSI